jgi:hypothetical protein
MARASIAAGLLELGEHGAEVVGDHRCHPQAGAGDRGGEQEGAGFDAVGDDGVVGAVEAIDPHDRDRGGAGAAHLGTHRDQQARQIHHFRLEGGVLDHRFAVGQGGGHHQGFGGPHTRAVKVDAAAGEAMAAAGHHSRHDTVLDRDLGAQGLEPLDMLHHRPGADLAAAGQGDAGRAEAGEQGADAEEARPQAVHQLIGGRGMAEVAGAHLDGVAVAAHAHAEGFENVAQGGDIGERRHIAQAQSVPGEQAGGHQHQG